MNNYNVLVILLTQALLSSNESRNSVAGQSARQWATEPINERMEKGILTNCVLLPTIYYLDLG